MLIAQVLEKVPRGTFVQVVLVAKERGRDLRVGRAQRSRERADRAAELERSVRGLAFPEGHLSRYARRGRDEDAIVRDLLHPPGRRSEQEGLPHARLEDHLLIELADATLSRLRAHKEDAIQTTVRDRAA